MGVVEFRVLSAASSSGALARLDSFAALRVGPVFDPSIGGFRFVPAKEARRALLMRRISRRLARPLPLLFIGALAVAILARPSSEPHAAMSRDAETPARLSYAQPSISSEAHVRVTMGEAPAGMGMMGDPAARLELAALGEASFAAGSSPITTSTLPPAAGAALHELRAEPAHVGLLPPGSETLADAPPVLVRLAAVTPADGELVDVLPTVDGPTPSGSSAVAPGPESETAHGAEAKSERAVTKPREASPRLRRARSRSRPASKKVGRPPRWAKQMFDNPWQSSAFSYVR